MEVTSYDNHCLYYQRIEPLMTKWLANFWHDYPSHILLHLDPGTFAFPKLRNDESNEHDDAVRQQDQADHLLDHWEEVRHGSQADC